MHFLGVNEAGIAGFCTIGEDRNNPLWRKVLRWCSIDTSELANALKTIPKNEIVKVTIVGTFVTGVQLPNGNIVGDFGGDS
jgi:hypothetical protein